MLDPGEYLIDTPSDPLFPVTAITPGRPPVVVEANPMRKVFHRVAIKHHKDGRRETLRYLVIHHNGTKIYIGADSIIITDREWYPP